MFTMLIISVTKYIHQDFEELGDRKEFRNIISLAVSLDGGGKGEILIPMIKNLELGGYFQGRERERRKWAWGW